MFWKRRAKVWPVDPGKVSFGSVVVGGKNLSRSHVRVRYRGASRPQEMPLEAFVKQAGPNLRDGTGLEIEQLLVAPMLKQRYPAFFDRLTDWGPAARRAMAASPRRRQRELGAS